MREQTMGKENSIVGDPAKGTTLSNNWLKVECGSRDEGQWYTGNPVRYEGSILHGSNLGS